MIQYAKISRIVNVWSRLRPENSLGKSRYINDARRHMSKDSWKDKRSNPDIRKENTNDSSLTRSRRSQPQNTKTTKETTVGSLAELGNICEPGGAQSQAPKLDNKPASSENQQCVVKPHSCPPPTLSPECTPKPIDCAAQEAKSSSQSGKESGKGSADPPPPSGGFLKWLIGTAALAAGGAVGYYFYEKNKNEASDRTSQLKRGSRKHRFISEPVKFPPTSVDIPKEVEYLLIGGGTAAFSAFRAIKSRDPKAKVLVISRESEFPYMRPPLSKELWSSDEPSREKLMFKQWNGSIRSVFYEPESFYMDAKALMASTKGGVSVARGWTVTAVDALRKEATLDDGSVITYNKCLIAPGSRAKTIPVVENASESAKDKIFYFRNVADFKALSSAVGTSGDVTIIGGGLLGSELACSLTKQGSHVTHVFREGGLLAKILPPYLSGWLTRQIQHLGIDVLAQSDVVAIEREGERLRISLANGKKVETDVCVVAAGAAPDTDLATTSKLETDPSLGGFIVNSEMQARSHLYVAGDAACFFDERFGRRRVEHHDHAVVSGRLAGENMAGAGKPYIHLSMLWSDYGPDIGWEGVGLLDSALKTVAVFRLKEEKAQPVSDPANESTVTPSSDSQATKTIVRVNSAEGEERSKEDFSKGVVFYLREGVIVGVLLWNLFGRIELARQVLREQCRYDEDTINELAKHFSIHSD